MRKKCFLLVLNKNNYLIVLVVFGALLRQPPGLLAQFSPIAEAKTPAERNAPEIALTFVLLSSKTTVTNPIFMSVLIEIIPGCFLMNFSTFFFEDLEIMALN